MHLNRACQQSSCVSINFLIFFDGELGEPAPRLLGVVSHASTFGPTVDNDDRGVHIEEEGVALVGQGEQIGAQAVVKTYQWSNTFGRKALHEAAQGALVGESLQPEHLQKSPVVLKDVGLVDTAQSHNDRTKQGHNQLGRVICARAATHFDIALNQVPQAQLVAKTLDEPQCDRYAVLPGANALPVSRPQGPQTRSRPSVSLEHFDPPVCDSFSSRYRYHNASPIDKATMSTLPALWPLLPLSATLDCETSQPPLF